MYYSFYIYLKTKKKKVDFIRIITTEDGGIILTGVYFLRLHTKSIKSRTGAKKKNPLLRPGVFSSANTHCYYCERSSDS